MNILLKIKVQRRYMPHFKAFGMIWHDKFAVLKNSNDLS